VVRKQKQSTALGTWMLFKYHIVKDVSSTNWDD